MPDLVSSNHTILIVDDLKTNRMVLRDFLKPAGFHVVEATNGEEALERVQESPPDLILLDIVMPKLDGFQVCRRLKENPVTALIPVVFMTALDKTEDHVKGLEAGADDFLSKPFNRALLSARLTSLLKMKALRDSLDQAEDVILSLARAIEARDHFTEEHVERVADFAVALARLTGYEEDALRDVRYGGILHDIGKIGVPDFILNKRGPLNPDEAAVMERHPVVGWEICKRLRSVAGVLPLVRHHHEKLDGTGYPDHLQGSQISVSARIMAITDIYDACTSNRSYRQAMTQQGACELLLAEAAVKKLDAELVNLFIAKVIPEEEARQRAAAAAAPEPAPSPAP
jgi:putative two-component system response regulator